MSAPPPGALVPPPKFTIPGGEGKLLDVPFAHLPRIDRLEVTGKYDVTEEPSDKSDSEADSRSDAGDEEDAGKENAGQGKKDLKERAKKKMRGRNKSMKRCVETS